MAIPEIQIGIMSAGLVRFEINGTYLNEETGRLETGTYHLAVQNDKIQLEGNGKTWLLEEVILKPMRLNKDTITLHEVTIGKEFHWEKRESQIFRGSFRIICNENLLSVINLISVEDYLISVISSEMSATSSSELLKAHAVISRGWALRQIENRRTLHLGEQQHSSWSDDREIVRWYDRENHQLFDVCADDHCQRYQGIGRAGNLSVEEAVDQTKGLVLMYQGYLCDTRFSKCCGGVTELFENTWEPVNHPYLSAFRDIPAGNKVNSDLSNEEDARAWIMSSPDAFCNTADEMILRQVLNDYDRITTDFFRWKLSYTSEELTLLIRKRTGIDFGRIHDLVPVLRGKSGRIIKLQISGTQKTMILGKELEIRKALSESHLYSSAFVVDKTEKEGTVVFNLYGAGWGHGVGLCQIGAAVMGAKGYNFRQILEHYYPGAVLRRRY